MREEFVTDEIYHVYNRGVDKRDIFLNRVDHLRFIHNLFEFNDVHQVIHSDQSIAIRSRCGDFENRHISGVRRKPRDPIVEILCFVLMSNHFHLLLRERTEGGIVKFMRRIGVGYANYFNTKNERSGALFEGRYKSVHVTHEAHLLYLPHYIHLNALDIWKPGWKEHGVGNVRDAMNFLTTYRWSSFPDYTGVKNFPSVTEREFLTSLHGGTAEMRKDIEGWIRESNFSEIEGVTID